MEVSSKTGICMFLVKSQDLGSVWQSASRRNSALLYMPLSKPLTLLKLPIVVGSTKIPGIAKMPRWEWHGPLPSAGVIAHVSTVFSLDGHRWYRKHILRSTPFVEFGGPCRGQEILGWRNH